MDLNQPTPPTNGTWRCIGCDTWNDAGKCMICAYDSSGNDTTRPADVHAP